MGQQTMKIATLLAIGLLMHASSAAQNDPINCTACGGGTTYGQYLTFGASTSNLVLTGPGTHTINNSTGSYPLEHNLVGGLNNTLRDNSSTGAEGNFIHGEGNTITGTDGGVALGTNNSIDGSDLSYAFGDGNSITGGDASTAFGEDITVNDDNAHGYGAGIDVSSQEAIVFGYGDLGSSTDLTDIGAKSITLGLDANNILNLKLNSSSNPVTGIGTGTSTPGSKLEIVGNGTSSSTSALEVQNSNNTSMLFVRDDGNVGIGTNSPAAQLVVDGDILPVNNTGTNTSNHKIGNSSNRWEEIWLTNGSVNGSDKRLKKDIESLTYGIKEIMKLNPVSYKMKDLDTENKNLGLIAQDLEKVINEPVETGDGERKLKGIRYTSLIPVLINGIQEQQKQVQKQQQQIQKLQANLEEEKAEKAALKEKVNQLNERVNQLAEQVNGVSESFKKADEESLNQKTATISSEDANQAMLLQNRPNPYSNETVIPYYLPENAQNANMLITNTQGQMLKRIPLEGTGKGELTLQTADLNQGQYQYTLIIDGRQIQTRKMIVK